MSRVVKWGLRGVFLLALLVALAGGGLWAFGPREPLEVDFSFDEGALAGGVDAYLARREEGVSGLQAGVEKRVIWADAPEVKTAYSVLYVHGFSASSEEIRPVPDLVAEALGANLVFTRLRGHGLKAGKGAAMGTVRAVDWSRDVGEALAVARAVGEQLVVISTSTGGTLMALAALEPAAMDQVAAQIFVAPNFGVNSAFAPVMTWPAARWWAPLIAGETREFTPRNAAQARFWTTQYPTVAVLPMAVLVEHAMAQDLSGATVPALFLYARADRVVDPVQTDRVVAQWGGPAAVVHPVMGAGDDPFAHVVAGDILSPGQTGLAVQGMVDWLAQQGVE